jgi:hypothetical protein
MIRLVNLIVFGGCALAVAHYTGLGNTMELVGALVLAVCLMRVLSTRRPQRGVLAKRSGLSVTESSH